MPNKHLATYLNDHLAGSVAALELLSHLCGAYANTDVAEFAERLRADIAADRGQLEELMERLNISRSATRRVSAWVGEKFVELKLRFDDVGAGPLRLLEATDALSVAIEGKRLLWVGLDAASKDRPALRHDYDQLIGRAEEQRARVEAVRLKAARERWRRGTKDSGGRIVPVYSSPGLSRERMPQVTIHQAIEAGLAHHVAGRLRDAEAIYRQVLAQARISRTLCICWARSPRNWAAIRRRSSCSKERFGSTPTTPRITTTSATSSMASAASTRRWRVIEPRALKPDFAEAHSHLGNTLRSKGELEAAIEACRRAIELKPSYVAAFINLANALRDQGELAEAIATYGRAIELQPENSLAHNNLGCALSDQGISMRR